MTTINTTLTTSGNSIAVRLPRELLKMSGLGNKVTLEARQGKIIISKPANPREGWEEQIGTLTALHGDPTEQFGEMDIAAADGLADAPWNGPTYQEWLNSHKSDAELS